MDWKEERVGSIVEVKECKIELNFLKSRRVLCEISSKKILNF